QLKPKEISSIEGVDIVLGAAEKFDVLEYINALDGGQQKASVHAADIHLANTFRPAYSSGDRTRSFLKVQDGCDYKCTFCTIPQARGQSRSAEVDDVIAQARSLGQSGIKEIVLTGVNIGDFGKGTSVMEGQRQKSEALFIDLIRALDNVSDVPRFRISSIEPNLCTDEIIDFVATSSRFMPHFHMPLQSGNNEILGKMRRRYKRELYAERGNRIRSQMPHACIGVDVITGFPGESDDHFLDSFQFLQTLEVDYIHAFTYSERENTPAALMHEAVPVNVRRERSNALRLLSQNKKADHYAKHLGQIRNVLFEKGPDEKMLSGFTDNYIRIALNESSSQVNTIQQVFLREIVKIKNDIFAAAVLQ
ncbi:MAG TPA: MiaB/RimO family radical SAM methylthiotransferase, partial [Saprospiraceae bacterium]|nr:MiaB/RimO family radical SAM methylthiotransferase [Saprospiraceae bacterium]